MKKMKKILLLLLFTIASYGQAVFDEGIQITGNANSATATKVNVQEANGKVNTQTINTGFNKNIGLNTGDVVGANTLLNQYSITPVDWTATSFSSGQVVFHGGKQWIAKMATVAGDVPAVSSTWEEITFESLANKTTTVDQTIIDGSTNAVSSNAVFDALATKAPLASPALTGTPTAPTATVGTNTTQIATTAFVTGAISTADSVNVKLTGNQSIAGIKSFTSIISSTGGITVSNPTGSNFLANQTTGSNFNYIGQNSGTDTFTVNKFGATTATSFIKSSAPTTNILLAGGGDVAQSTFQPAITGLTTNYLPKWNGSGFGNSQIFDNGTNVGIGTTNVTDKLTVGGTISMYGASKVVGDGGFYINGSGGVNGDGGAIFLNNGLGSKTWKISTGIKFNFQDGFSIGNNTLLSALYIKDNGNVLIGTILDNGVDKLQVNGTISASPATTANQVVVKSQLDAVAARPYKVYTALLTQTGSNIPAVTVIENTLGTTISYSLGGTGFVVATSSTTSFTDPNKVFISISNGNGAGFFSVLRIQDNQVRIVQQNIAGVNTDGLLQTANFEIRVYN